MERWLLSLFLERAILVLLPLTVWLIWARWARRNGREMGATPWGWLIGAGAALAGLSLMATAVFHGDNRADTYIPPQTTADGRVIPGHFVKKAQK